MEVKKIFSPFSQILSLMPNMMIVLYTVPDSVKNNNVVEYKYNSNKKPKKQLQYFQKKYVYIDLEKTDKVWYNYIKGTNLLTGTYTYSDAWGHHSVSYANDGGSTGAQYNPFRYRGYYYDADLGMYYLQSRYYDAKICRFISADSYTSTGQGILSTNMFAYCGNNPVMGYDPTGHWDWGGFAVGVALVVGSCVALCYGSWQTEPTLSATIAVMTTGVVMIYAAATDSVMVIDLSGTLQADRPIYGKAGGTLLIDFNEDEMFLYGHAGFGIGYSNAITYSVGLVQNYENPEDYSKHFIGGSVGGVMGVNHCWSPDYEYCDAPKATSLTFSKDLGIGSMIGISIGAEYDYYSSPIPIFSWGGD